MANNIKVSLTNGVLDVDETNTNHVLCRVGGQDIHWHLEEDQSQGQLLAWEPLGTSTPGFVWISTPPTGRFDEPSIHNKLLTIRAHHLDKTSVGCWIYMLRIRDLKTGRVYSTTVSQTTLTDPNPQGRCGDPTGPAPVVTTMAKVSENPIIINR